MAASQPYASAVFVLFAAYAAMGAWDGLARHHIRVRPGEWLPSLAVRGPVAFAIGAVCALSLVLLGRVAAMGLPAMVAGCADPSCAVGRVIVSPFITVPSALIALAAGGVFAPWLWGMGDLDGPFRTRLLAPGVWYRERELVTLAQNQLREQRRSPMDVDIILDIADDLLRTFHGVSPTMTGAPEQNTSGSAMSREMHARFLAHTYRARKRPGVTLVAQQSVVETVALYTMGS